MVKKTKSMPKDSQNDAKMDAQIHDFLSFFKKDEIYEIKPPLGREHDFTGSGHLKMHDKSIQNRCQEKVCKKYGKLCQNGPQMEAQIARQIEKMRKKASKMRAEKTHDFWESPGRDFLSPGSPKMNTNQQDNLQKNNKKKTTYSR